MVNKEFHMFSSCIWPFLERRSDYILFAAAEFLLGVSVLSNSLLYLSLTVSAYMQLCLPKEIHYEISALHMSSVRGLYCAKNTLCLPFHHSYFLPIKGKVVFSDLLRSYWSLPNLNILIHIFQCNFSCLLMCLGKVFSDHTDNIPLDPFALQMILLDGLLWCLKNSFC